MSECKFRVKLDRPSEMADRDLDIFVRDRVKHKASQLITPPKIFYVSNRITGYGHGNARMCTRFELTFQSRHHPLRDRVLQSDYVIGIGIDLLAPQNVSVYDIDQLRRHPYPLFRNQEIGGEDRIDF